MKITFGMPRLALSSCLIIILCSPAAGRLQYRQPLAAAPAAASPPLPIGVSAEAKEHILSNIKQLREEAGIAVQTQAARLSAISLRKEREARDAIEKEIPLATANDTAELAKDLADGEAQLDAALHRSTEEADEGLRLLKEKTAISVNMSSIEAVKNVEKETERDAKEISKSSVKMRQEAEALAKEAKGAANYSQEAEANTLQWVQELPIKDAAEAVKNAKASERQSVLLRHEYEDIKRFAKLSGNMALNTMTMAQEAIAQTDKAKQEAILTMEQASQNALLLNTIRVETNSASNTAMGVVAVMGS